MTGRFSFAIVASIPLQLSDFFLIHPLSITSAHSCSWVTTSTLPLQKQLRGRLRRIEPPPVSQTESASQPDTEGRIFNVRREELKSFFFGFPRDRTNSCRSRLDLCLCALLHNHIMVDHDEACTQHIALVPRSSATPHDIAAVSAQWPLTRK